MTDSEKLSRILKIVDKQQQETYIPTKWKPVIDHLEKSGCDPLKVLEALIGLDNLFEERQKRIEREAKEKDK